MSFFDDVMDMKLQCLKEAAAAKADGRYDEAVQARVRSNVYDICCTVYGALQRAMGAAFPAAYEKKLQELGAAWTAARDEAEANGDADRAFTEEIKLAALQDVLRRWEEAKHDGE